MASPKKKPRYRKYVVVKVNRRSLYRVTQWKYFEKYPIHLLPKIYFHTKFWDKAVREAERLTKKHNARLRRKRLRRERNR